ncbi:MAG TPA: metalloregulator ArsR/SmtB family transcription factor [Terrimesophilobacter sp.]|jgi:Predicted transcriptional regulators|uniref:ArsR/SmtB family transcription factor n=1 Tax=Terrimesophilobacter sp. TaxID=2906435 RepID=UPI002F941F31
MPTELPVAALKAELFKALAHPARVRALEKLVVAEISVGELAELLDIEIAQLSQQLAVLRKAGIVVTRRDGNTIFYSVRDPRLSQLLAVAREILMSTLQDSQVILASLEAEHAQGSHHGGAR